MMQCGEFKKTHSFDEEFHLDYDWGDPWKDIYISKDKYINDMLITAENEKQFRKIARDEFEKLFIKNWEILKQLKFLKGLNPIEKDEKALDELFELCKKKPKKFSSKKEYIKWVEKGE